MACGKVSSSYEDGKRRGAFRQRGTRTRMTRAGARGAAWEVRAMQMCCMNVHTHYGVRGAYVGQRMGMRAKVSGFGPR
jgi:hypothetical protein